jgi:NADH:ubiquinone oxidoreductase subunit B-like Fe-S oxidoreductase
MYVPGFPRPLNAVIENIKSLFMIIQRERSQEKLETVSHSLRRTAQKK